MIPPICNDLVVLYVLGASMDRVERLAAWRAAMPERRVDVDERVGFGWTVALGSPQGGLGQPGCTGVTAGVGSSLNAVIDEALRMAERGELLDGVEFA